VRPDAITTIRLRDFCDRCPSKLGETTVIQYRVFDGEGSAKLCGACLRTLVAAWVRYLDRLAGSDLIDEEWKCD
jgi:hypothetical protein